MAYGFEVRRSDGTLQVSDSMTVLRYIATEEFAANASESRHVPDFDDTRGILQITFDPFLSFSSFYLDVASFPNVTWNNSTKMLTVSPGQQARMDYSVSLYHYG